MIEQIEQKMHLETIRILTDQVNQWREMTARLHRWMEDVDVRDLIIRDAARSSHMADDFKEDCERAYQMLKTINAREV